MWAVSAFAKGCGRSGKRRWRLENVGTAETFSLSGGFFLGGLSGLGPCSLNEEEGDIVSGDRHGCGNDQRAEEQRATYGEEC